MARYFSKIPSHWLLTLTSSHQESNWSKIDATKYAQNQGNPFSRLSMPNFASESATQSTASAAVFYPVGLFSRKLGTCHVFHDRGFAVPGPVRPSLISLAS